MKSAWLVGLGLAALILAPAAGAEMAGPCEATLEDEAIERLDADDADDAVAVPADEPATIAFAADSPMETWTASIHYGPFEAPLTMGEAPANATSAQAEIPVQGFSWLGAGLYTVSGTVELEDGSTCHGEALIDIQGETLGTVLGASAASVTAIGGLGLVAGFRDGYKEALDEARSS